MSSVRRLCQPEPWSAATVRRASPSRSTSSFACAASAWRTSCRATSTRPWCNSQGAPVEDARLRFNKAHRRRRGGRSSEGRPAAAPPLTSLQKEDVPRPRERPRALPRPSRDASPREALTLDHPTLTYWWFQGGPCHSAQLASERAQHGVRLGGSSCSSPSVRRFVISPSSRSRPRRHAGRRLQRRRSGRSPRRGRSGGAAHQRHGPGGLGAQRTRFDPNLTFDLLADGRRS